MWQAHITLTDVPVPEANRLPQARSFKDTARVLAGTRNAVAWAALGHATAAYEIAIDYCTERTQFGKPLVSFQIVQDKLVKMLADVCSMQLYCLQLGRLMEQGQLTDTIAAIAKMNNTRRAREVVSEARDLLGGNGILHDYDVMRHMCDLEALFTYEGTIPGQHVDRRAGDHGRRGVRLMTYPPAPGHRPRARGAGLGAPGNRTRTAAGHLQRHRSQPRPAGAVRRRPRPSHRGRQLRRPRVGWLAETPAPRLTYSRQKRT